jgi:hypothetical protein
MGVRPEVQLVRLSSQIDPFREIPAAPVQDVTAAATLASMRGSRIPTIDSAGELEVLVDVGEE